ncbi:MAG: glutaredoxin domain-containing protein [Desulfuromonadaceae bacterium]
MNIFNRWIVLSTLTVLASAAISYASSESAKASQRQTARFPAIAIYTQPGCKSCTAASDFLTSNKIPFTKKDIFQNPDFQEELTVKYKTRGVPVIVIGNDEKILKGYVQEALQLAVREVMAKHR